MEYSDTEEATTPMKGTRKQPIASSMNKLIQMINTAKPGRRVSRRGTKRSRSRSVSSRGSITKYRISDQSQEEDDDDDDAGDDEDERERERERNAKYNRRRSNKGKGRMIKVERKRGSK